MEDSTISDEPTISIYTMPMQQIATKKIDVLEYSTSPDKQLAIDSPELPPAYAVVVSGKNHIGESHTCTFFTRTAMESKQTAARINDAVNFNTSLVIHPDPTVNKVL